LYRTVSCSSPRAESRKTHTTDRPFEWDWRCETVFPVSAVVRDGCAGGGVLLGAVPALFWCGEVSLAGKHIISAGSVTIGGQTGRWVGRVTKDESRITTIVYC